MELRVKPAHVGDLIERFNELSAQPSSLANVALKLEPITEAVTLCIKYNTQVRQAQRVAMFLGDVMADKKQEETVHMVASMALQTLMNHIRPVEAIAERPLQKTRHWSMGSAPQRVHAGAMSKAARLHADMAHMRIQLAQSRKADKPEPHELPQTPYMRRKLEAKAAAAETATPEAKARHKRWERGSLLGKTKPT